VTERDGVRWRKILHLTGCKILHLTGYDVSDAVHTTLALDIYMSVPQTAAYDISVSKFTLLSASGFDFGNRRLFLSLVTYGLHWISNLTPV
jgi:hypothetical protein